jgi:transcription initiation factor TFIIB
MERGERLDWEFLDEVFGFSDFLECVEKFEILHGDERSNRGDAVRLAVAFCPSPFHEFVQRRLNGASGERERVGSPTTKMLHDEGISTEIDWRNEDAYGNSLSSRQRQKMNRLRKWHTRSQTANAQERNLRHALGEIERMASALGLPQSTRETASVLYRRALDEDLLRGRSIEGMSTAAVYAAARQAGIPRSLDEVTAVSRIEQLRITRTYRHLSRELGLEIEPADPLDYIPRLASDLDLSEEAEQQSRDLLTSVIETDESYLSGKNPVGLAAAAVYAGALLTNEKVTQPAVGEVADISKLTIRNRYQDLLEIGEDLQVR